MVHFAALFWLCLSAAPCFLLQVAGVPVFKFDLDLPPEQRWTEISTHYKEEMLAIQKELTPILDNIPNRDEWVSLLDQIYGPELTAEMTGMVKAIGLATKGKPFDNFRLMQLLYELGSPTMPSSKEEIKRGMDKEGYGAACSGVLWAATNGTVLHGRNLEYIAKFKMPDGEIKGWNDVTFDAIFYRDQKPLLRTTTWPGVVGVSTGMRYDGWSFEQNTRKGHELAALNLKAAKKGGQAFSVHARRLMEKTSDYKTALSDMWNAKVMAPCYFVMSGPGAYEGATLAMDRLGKHLSTSQPLMRLSASNSAWHLMQTNEDVMKQSPLGFASTDPRHPLARELLRGVKQDAVTPEHLEDFMHTPLLFNVDTVFTTVMCVRTGFYKTILPDEAPYPSEAIHATAEGFGALTEKGRKARVQKRRLLLKAAQKLSADIAHGGIDGGEYFSNVDFPDAWTAPIKDDMRDLTNALSAQHKRNLRHESCGAGLRPFFFSLALAACSCLWFGTAGGL